jgi:hypothetical protein
VDDTLQYDKLVESALKGVVRSALEIVKKHGLTGGHHFYITFRTSHPQVVVPKYLQEKYPDEMTIVLQYQFYNLEVEETRFSVSLSFNNVQEHLVVPFAAIVGFADPSVKFGLQFHTRELMEEPQEAQILDLTESQERNEGKKETGSKRPGRTKGSRSKAAKESGEGGDGNNVVSLDSFRKKK